MTKPATLETGVVIQVPIFVNIGDRVKVDTRTNGYLGRDNAFSGPGPCFRAG